MAIRERTWIEIAVAIAALIVSGISLWVGVRTEDANEQVVASSTWPFVEIQTNDITYGGQPRIQFILVNGGVGPAKLETFEMFYKGKPMTSYKGYLAACCHFDLARYRADYDASPANKKPAPLIFGAPQDIVLRAGEARPILTVVRGANNAAFWNALDKARGDTAFRVCYCSVLNRCWTSDLLTLHPKRVDKCTSAKYPFNG